MIYATSVMSDDALGSYSLCKINELEYKKLVVLCHIYDYDTTGSKFLQEVIFNNLRIVEIM